MKKLRLNLELSPDVASRLRKLKSDTDSASLVEVIRRALAIYEFLTKSTKDGSEIVLRTGEGDKVLILPAR